MPTATAPLETNKRHQSNMTPDARRESRDKTRGAKLKTCLCGCKIKFHPHNAGTANEQKFASQECRRKYHNAKLCKLLKLAKSMQSAA